MIKYSIAKQYTETPGPRFIKEGNFSGEHFRDTILQGLVKQAKHEKKNIQIDFDGGYGYPTSFLEEAFGGLIRALKDKTVISMFKFKSDEEPTLIDEINEYMKKAAEGIK